MAVTNSPALGTRAGSPAGTGRPSRRPLTASSASTTSPATSAAAPTGPESTAQGPPCRPLAVVHLVEGHPAAAGALEQGEEHPAGVAVPRLQPDVAERVGAAEHVGRPRAQRGADQHGAAVTLEHRHRPRRGLEADAVGDGDPLDAATRVEGLDRHGIAGRAPEGWRRRRSSSDRAAGRAGSSRARTSSPPPRRKPSTASSSAPLKLTVGSTTKSTSVPARSRSPLSRRTSRPSPPPPPPSQL